MNLDRFRVVATAARVGALLLIAACHDAAPEARSSAAPVVTNAPSMTSATSASAPAAPSSVAPFASAGRFDLRNCPGSPELLSYSDITMDSEETGDLSGTEIYLTRTDTGWRATGGTAGGGPPIHTSVRELVISSDSGASDALFRIAIPFNRRLESDMVIEGRIDCDSIWGTWTLRGGQNGPPEPELLRREALKPIDRVVTSGATHPAGTLFRTDTLGGTPFAAAIAPNGTAYVTQLTSGYLSRAERPDDSFTVLMKVGRIPSQIRVSAAGLVYVGNQDTPSIDVINGRTGRRQATWPLPSSVLTLGVSPDGSRVYAPTSDSGMLVMNAQSGEVLATVDVGMTPTGIAFHPTKPIVYVAARDGGTVRAIDMLTNAVIDTFVTKGSPQNVAVSPDGEELYVTDIGDGSLQTWSLAIGRLTGMSRIGHTAQRNAFDVAVTPDGAQIWVTALAEGSIIVFDRRTRHQERTIQVGGRPRYIAFDAKGTTAVIPNEDGWVSVVH